LTPEDVASCALANELSNRRDSLADIDSIDSASKNNKTKIVWVFDN